MRSLRNNIKAKEPTFIAFTKEEFPKNCAVCLFHSMQTMDCMLLHKQTDEEDMFEFRLDDCPLRLRRDNNETN